MCLFLLFPATMSVFQEYHEWVDIDPISNARLKDSNGDYVVVSGQMSNEQLAAGLIESWSKATPMSTLIVELPTADPAHVMSYDIAYHYQDAVRARDPEGLTAQFARPARPGNSAQFSNMAHAAQVRT